MRVRNRLAVCLAVVPLLVAGCGDSSPPAIDLKKAAEEQEAAQQQADDEEMQNIKDRKQERLSSKK